MGRLTDQWPARTPQEKEETICNHAVTQDKSTNTVNWSLVMCWSHFKEILLLGLEVEHLHFHGSQVLGVILFRQTAKYLTV